MWKISQWQISRSGKLSTTTESFLSIIWVLNARKLEVKYLAIYNEKLFLIRNEWSDSLSQSWKANLFIWMKNHNPYTLRSDHTFDFRNRGIPALKAEWFACLSISLETASHYPLASFIMACTL